MIKSLFTYGTLMQEATNYPPMFQKNSYYQRSSILNPFSYSVAVIHNYQRVWSIELGFPIITSKKESIVKGELYHHIPDEVINHLDLIEGVPSLYIRISESAYVNDERFECEVYVPSLSFKERFMNKPDLVFV